MRLLDRYVLKNFLLPFVYCVAGFLAIWFVFEMGSKASEFINAGVTFLGVLDFYRGQLPAVALIVLPVALLLALLYCLGRMSQSNEILAMLGSGVGLGRILRPIFLLGLAVTGLSTWLSYAPAPQAEARRDLAEAEMEAGAKLQRLTSIPGYLFRNRRDHRLWYVQNMPANPGLPLAGVQVIQQDAQDNIVAKWYAKSAAYDPARHAWIFSGNKLVRYTPAGDVAAQSYPAREVITGWSETPWRLSSALLQADRLSVPELRQYLDLNADFTRPQLAPFRTYLDVRWALPWGCFVVVLFAAPLGIVYQRRSVVTGVATSILLFLLILFFDSLFRALGRGDRIEPFWAAWTTNLFFALVGVILLRQRMLNRDKLPLTPAQLWDYLTA